MSEEEASLNEILTEVGSSIYIKEKCKDCGVPIKVKVILEKAAYLFEPEDGYLYKVKQNDGNEELYYKCQKCYDKQPTLYNWRNTEVYTRVVGYYRPISNFNKGKKEEYKQRVSFDLFKPEQNIGEFE